MLIVMFKKIHQLIFIVLILCVFVEGFSHGTSSSVCHDSVCKEISGCESVLKNLRNSAPVMCGWSGKTPLVCCPGTELASENSCASLTPNSTDSNFQVRPLLPFPEPNPGLTVKPLIIGGKSSSPNSRPWMAAVLDKGPADFIQRVFCGASLIGARHVLTAAHCFLGRTLDGREIEVLLGSNNLASASRFDVDKIILHPEFLEPTWYNDIAIIRLQKTVTFGISIRPICLPHPTARNIKFQSSMITVAGWGRIKFGGELSEQLKEVNLPVVSNDKCNSTFMSIRGAQRRYPSGISDSIICAGSDEKKDACAGDSGGPMFLPDNTTQHWLIIGVVSTGFQCAVPGIPGIYTRVTSYIDWIAANLN